MPERIRLHPHESELIQRWHGAHIRAAEESEEFRRGWRAANITPQADEARRLLDTLRRTRDLSAFQSESNRWSRSFPSGFSGVAGQMIINQIAKIAPDHEAAITVLLDALETPTDIDDAAEKIKGLADYLDSRSRPARRAPSSRVFLGSQGPTGPSRGRSRRTTWTTAGYLLRSGPSRAAPIRHGVDGDVRFEMPHGGQTTTRAIDDSSIACGTAARGGSAVPQQRQAL